MTKKRHAIVSVTNDLLTDNRVHKTCMVLHELGYNVTLIGRKRKSSGELLPRPYHTKRMRLQFEKGALFYAFFNIRLLIYLLFHKADLLVANDLDTLLANYVAFKLKKRARLVYDTHELFTEVPELINRPRVQNIWLKIEKRIFPNLDTIITVNQSIADIYNERYGKKLYVVRNISPQWIVSNTITKKELGIPEDQPILILQGAGINVDRGAEELVEAMQDIDATLLIVGDGDVVQRLKERVKNLQLNDRVLFFGRRPYNEMMQFTQQADIGFTLDKPTNLNYRFSLPNKVFDYLHTNTAIVATDIKEVKNVIAKYDIGRIVDPLTPENIASVVNDLLTDSNTLFQLQENCRKTSKIENWEVESQILKDIYY